MISKHLIADIESFLSDLRRKNRFFLRLALGEVGPRNVAALLYGTRHLLLHTPIHLQIAVDHTRALSNELPQLLPYFHHHLDEEVGHDQWAVDDMRQLQTISSTSLPERVSPAMLQLVDYTRSLVETDPVLYVPYILFAEYLSVIAVPEVVGLLETRCGIPARVMSVFTKHAELDKEHSKQDCAILDQIVGVSPLYEHSMRNVVRYSSVLYSHFLNDVSDAG